MCPSPSEAELCRGLTMSFRFELLTLILALTLTGQVDMAQIIGGHEAVPHSRPYMVALEMHRDNNEKKFCAGFLLNEDFVMTAAHCQANSYHVLLGLHDFFKKNDTQRIQVEQTFPNKDYNSSNLKNDIMLLKLQTKAKLSETVKPIALGGKSSGSLPKSCSVSGWGRTDLNSSYLSDVLMEVNVTLVEDEQCERRNLYCSKGKTGPYIGDSGGPLVCENGEAYGVISFAQQHSNSIDIFAYSKISDYRQWIYRTIRNA